MHQILFRIPAFHLGSHAFAGFYIYTYGVVLSLAFAFSLSYAILRAKSRGGSPDVIADACILLLVAGVVGSRLLFVIEEWPDYASNPWSIFNIREGGLTIQGGLIAGVLAGWFYAKIRKIDFWKNADLLAPPIAVGMGIGRIGCFFNGCCLGIPTTLPWGMVFKDNPTFFGPRHPTQLYEMILDFAIAAVLAMGFKNTKPGTAFLWLWILTGVSRFFLEFLRADAIPAGPLSVAQWICLGLIAVAGILLVWRNRQTSPSRA